MKSALRTRRLLLRPLRDDDADAFAAMLADPRAMAHFPAPLSREESDATRASRVPEGHRLRRHVLYRIAAGATRSCSP